MTPIIFHNPNCGTSRNTLAIMKASGEQPNVIEYLKTPPTRDYLLELLALMQLLPRELLRQKENIYKELGLDNLALSDEQLIDAMMAHPILMNRPIVVTDKGAALCRPSEQVFELLNHPVSSFTKEDGEIIYNSRDNIISEAGNYDDLPNIDAAELQPIDIDALIATNDLRHPPKILVLYGSLRERSFSKLAAEEASRILRWYGCEVRTFDPSGLPLPDSTDADHPKVQELRELAAWSEGMLWVSPERHGSITSIMKAQIDWIPLSLGGVRPTQGKTLAVMQVSGGSQSFNTVNQLRILGRWMRMITIPNQSSIPKAFLEFNDDNRMQQSPLYQRIVDVCEELVKFTWLTRGRSTYLTDRYSERVESRDELSKRVNQKSL
ncbi:arsenical resistance protein ArsH [Psychrobacter sp. DAB_AL62B]|nr:arsenical resistance protein ArsH [Psychrobacter sp. DAB_AL62B]